MSIIDRLSNAWNAFVGNEKREKEIYQAKPTLYYDVGHSSGYRPDRLLVSARSERSIVNAIFNRIAVDCSQILFNHVILDDNNRFKDTVDDGLNNCLSVEANKDQTARAFLQDFFMSLIDEGCVAIVPIDTTDDVAETNSYDILTMRVGKITQWFPDHVKVEVYNDRRGIKQEITMPKSDVCIVENPFYSVMNAKNSVAERLITKMNILDVIDKQSGSGKLDLIIQLPYVVKTDMRREQAKKRRADIEDQLTNSKFGIAYTDGTEKITQLNRPVENNIMSQIEYLTKLLYSQCYMSEKILDGTADEKEVLNYQNNMIKPMCNALVDEMNRKFLTKTARSQKHRIMYFNDPFKLVPIANLADIADKFTRNEILSTNEVRQIIGMKPVDAPQADELRNKNLNPGEDQSFASTTGDYADPEQYAEYDVNENEGENQNG